MRYPRSARKLLRSWPADEELVTVAVFVQPLVHRSHRRTSRDSIETLAPRDPARKGAHLVVATASRP